MRPALRGDAFGIAGVDPLREQPGKDRALLPYPVPTQAGQYYARPDVAYVPMPDAPPFEWGLVWPATAETTRVRAFNQAAQDLSRQPNRWTMPPRKTA